MLIVCYFRPSADSNFLTIRTEYMQYNAQASTGYRSTKLKAGSQLNRMANSALQRATWSLQSLRMSRQFTVSFTTASPRNVRLRNLHEDAARSTPGDISRRSSPIHGQTRSIFTSSKLRHDLEAKETANSKVHHNPPLVNSLLVITSLLRIQAPLKFKA